MRVLLAQVVFALFVGAVIGSTAVGVGGLIDSYYKEPSRVVPCEVEDSCTVDFYDGAWHIGPDGSAYAREGK